MGPDHADRIKAACEELRVPYACIDENADLVSSSSKPADLYNSPAARRRHQASTTCSPPAALCCCAICGYVHFWTRLFTWARMLPTDGCYPYDSCCGPIGTMSLIEYHEEDVQGGRVVPRVVPDVMER